MIQVMPRLTSNERSRFEQYERTIESGLNTFVEVGRALTEIRDAKLYRATHKTFESYCKDRWEISRPRAYALMEQASVGVALAEAGGGNLSCAQDISSRDAAAVKADLPTVTANIKARIERGEDPKMAQDAAVKAAREKAKSEEAEKRAQRKAKQAENDRQRDEHRASLAARNPAIGVIEAAKARNGSSHAAVSSTQTKSAEPTLSPEDRIAELEEEVRYLEGENATLKVRIAEDAELETMRSEWREGGWDKVIAKLKADWAEDTRVSASRIASESRDKVSWKRSADHWKAEAMKLGYSDREVIELNG